MNDVPALLVIDDDADIHELVRLLFEDRGFIVDALADGIDALRLEKHYDVIILDLNMPVFDGERLTDYWMLTDPGILQRVIVLSGYSRFTHGRQLEAFAVLRKPFTIEALVAAVENCLQSGSSGRLSGL